MKIRGRPRHNEVSINESKEADDSCDPLEIEDRGPNPEQHYHSRGCNESWRRSSTSLSQATGKSCYFATLMAFDRGNGASSSAISEFRAGEGRAGWAPHGGRTPEEWRRFHQDTIADPARWLFRRGHGSELPEGFISRRCEACSMGRSDRRTARRPPNESIVTGWEPASSRKGCRVRSKLA
jgi:hypothetical protein